VRPVGLKPDLHDHLPQGLELMGLYPSGPLLPGVHLGQDLGGEEALVQCLAPWGILDHPPLDVGQTHPLTQGAVRSKYLASSR
jgi:hypothetical protein